MKQWHWFVYILELENGRYYTGLTWNPSLRYEQHKAGVGAKYTAKYGVRKMVYLEEHNDLQEARKREIQIKDFSQKKKRQLINIFFERSEKLPDVISRMHSKNKFLLFERSEKLP